MDLLREVSFSKIYDSSTPILATALILWFIKRIFVPKLHPDVSNYFNSIIYEYLVFLDKIHLSHFLSRIMGSEVLKMRGPAAPPRLWRVRKK